MLDLLFRGGNMLAILGWLALVAAHFSHAGRAFVSGLDPYPAIRLLSPLGHDSAARNGERQHHRRNEPRTVHESSNAVTACNRITTE